MTTAFVICGALAREVLDIVERHGWDADVVGVPATHHLFPERIAPDVEKQILALHERYERIVVVYGDCGSKGALDRVLDRHGIERVSGPHCYEMYAGADFEAYMDQELGTFFLTDYLVRAFRGAVVKGLGLDRFPELKEQYFRHYRRVVYLAQSRDSKLRAKAQEIAAYLDLPLEIRYTGYGELEKRLVTLIEDTPADHPATERSLGPATAPPGHNGRSRMPSALERDAVTPTRRRRRPNRRHTAATPKPRP